MGETPSAPNPVPDGFAVGVPKGVPVPNELAGVPNRVLPPPLLLDTPPLCCAWMGPPNGFRPALMGVEEPRPPSPPPPDLPINFIKESKCIKNEVADSAFQPVGPKIWRSNCLISKKNYSNPLARGRLNML